MLLSFELLSDFISWLVFTPSLARSVRTLGLLIAYGNSGVGYRMEPCDNAIKLIVSSIDSKERIGYHGTDRRAGHTRWVV